MRLEAAIFLRVRMDMVKLSACAQRLAFMLFLYVQTETKYKIVIIYVPFTFYVVNLLHYGQRFWTSASDEGTSFFILSKLRTTVIMICEENYFPSVYKYIFQNNQC